MTAEQRALFDLMPYLEQDEYFDIHGYKMQPEVCPGTYILAVNNQHKAEDIWWTIEDFDHRGVWRRVINAKAENVLSANMFKDAFLGDRILVPATAIYEWQEQPDRSKKKYELWFDEPVFAMAGLARDCRVKDEEKRCGVILTTRANHVFTEIHNTSPRQPVVVHRRDFDKWLDPATPVEELKRIMEPVADEETHFAVAPEPPSAQASLFQ
jgi:putative SOS response-associated peptidase YedK